MYRARLRPKYSAEELKQIYRTPHNSNNWTDHQIRVRQTIALGQEAEMKWGRGRIADLSCGSGIIAKELASLFKAEPFLGDFAFAPGNLYTGPIELTLDDLEVNVDLFICSETIEHLDEPDNVLRRIRNRSRQLLLSTPIGERGTDNPEHYWGWDQEAVGHMLTTAGWEPRLRVDLNFSSDKYPYDYQIWLCQ